MAKFEIFLKSEKKRKIYRVKIGKSRERVRKKKVP